MPRLRKDGGGRGCKAQLHCTLNGRTLVAGFNAQCLSVAFYIAVARKHTRSPGLGRAIGGGRLCRLRARPACHAGLGGGLPGGGAGNSSVLLRSAEYSCAGDHAELPCLHVSIRAYVWRSELRCMVWRHTPLVDASNDNRQMSRTRWDVAELSGQETHHTSSILVEDLHRVFRAQGEEVLQHLLGSQYLPQMNSLVESGLAHLTCPALLHIRIHRSQYLSITWQSRQRRGASCGIHAVAFRDPANPDALGM